MFSLMKVEISTQVRDFIAALAPDPRKKLRQAIQLLSQNKGNIKLCRRIAGHVLSQDHQSQITAPNQSCSFKNPCIKCLQSGVTLSHNPTTL
jgi:hypothetical protein